MTDKQKLIQKYFQTLENFSTEKKDLEKFVHPDFVQVEYPNLIAKNGQERGIDGCLKGMERGKEILSSQRFEIVNQFESGNRVAVESIWTGEMAIEAGPLRKGQKLKAFLCMILEFKDGKIIRQRNYDCYEPFLPQ